MHFTETVQWRDLAGNFQSFIVYKTHRFIWKDTWFGALLTALLFAEGQHLITFYIGNSEVANLYDTAGSLLVLMLWVYYTSAIFLFGATFTASRINSKHSARVEQP
jgi:membrane protein